MRPKIRDIGTSVSGILSTVILYAISYFTTAGVLFLLCSVFHWTWWGWDTCFAFWLLFVFVSGLRFHVSTK